MTTRAQLHCLIDELPEAELEGVLQYVQVLHAFITAPVDDEPLSDADIAAIAGSRAEARRGELIPWVQIKRELADLP